MIRALAVAAFAVLVPATALADPHYECLNGDGDDPAARVEWCSRALGAEASSTDRTVDFEPGLLVARARAFLAQGRIGLARADLKAARKLTELLPEELFRVAAAMLEAGDTFHAREAADLVAGYAAEDPNLALDPVTLDGVRLAPAGLAALAACRMGDDEAARAEFRSRTGYRRTALQLACAAGFGGGTCGDDPDQAVEPWIASLCPAPRAGADAD